MARFDIRTLQNGSDIRGIASQGVPGEEVNLTKNTAGAIGTAFAVWLAQKLDKPVFTLKICVGRDPRISGEDLKEGIMTGVQMTGSKNYDAGIASSHAMYMSQRLPFYEFDGAVMITAGAMPYNWNGFRFYTEEGILEPEDVTWILEKAYKYAFIGEWFECEPVNLMEMYATYLRSLISNGLEGHTDKLKGMHIVVDAGNGSGGFFATDVLEKLGADISGSQFLEADGDFLNRNPDPENEEILTGIGRVVVDNGADLGIIFDTALDRAVVVGSDGKTVEYSDIKEEGTLFAVKNTVAATKLKKEEKTINEVNNEKEEKS